MSSKILLISIFFFLFFAGSAQAVEITQADDYQMSDFETCLKFANDNPHFKVAVMSTNCLFKGECNQFCCVYIDDNNHLWKYTAIGGDCRRIFGTQDDGCYIHVFEHGEEKQYWKYLVNNCNVFW